MSEMKTCDGCGERIDKSDARKSFVTVMRKGFIAGETHIKDKRYLFCELCGTNVLKVVRELENKKRWLENESKSFSMV